MPPGTLIPELLRERAAATPDRRAFVHLDDTGAEREVLTYARLDTAAAAVAARLREVCGPGDRALLLFPSGPDFLAAYFGCLYAGVVAVPMSLPRPNRARTVTRAILRDSEPSVVLTVAARAGELRAAFAAERDDLAWLHVDEIEPDRAAGAAFGGWDPDATAFLQYTSGSTSEPKGVMVTHRNLAANQEMIQEALGHDASSTFVGWTPLFHDQGLIGNVLQPLHLGALCVLFSPIAFIRRPLLWLTTISRYRAHTSGGPNFAFDVCAARAAAAGVPEDLDLSCWKVAFNGAEPLRHDTLDRFARVFAPYGFAPGAMYPCYGLAEATLLVSGSRKGRGPRTLVADAVELGQGRCVPADEGRTGRTLVGSGRVLPGETLRIVEPGTGRRLPDDRVGELLVCGEHVAAGYRGRPETTAQTFGARVDGDDRRYLRTGDLGVIVDGELFVVGRHKDLIIVRGRNHYPQDIEQTTEAAHPALRAGGCAAFAVEGTAAEELGVVAEVRKDLDPGTDPDEVVVAIRAAVLREHDVAPGTIVLIGPGELPRTSSGKVRRSAVRRDVAEGRITVWTAAAEPARRLS